MWTASFTMAYVPLPNVFPVRYWHHDQSVSSRSAGLVQAVQGGGSPGKGPSRASASSDTGSWVAAGDGEEGWWSMFKTMAAHLSLNALPRSLPGAPDRALHRPRAHRMGQRRRVRSCCAPRRRGSSRSALAQPAPASCVPTSHFPPATAPRSSATASLGSSPWTSTTPPPVAVDSVFRPAHSRLRPAAAPLRRHREIRRGLCSFAKAPRRLRCFLA